MARRVFYSFHYNPDNWRAAMVREIGSIEGNRPATDNLITTQAKRNLSSRSGIGGVLSAT